MRKTRKIMAVMVLAVILNIWAGAGVALAAPTQINCNNLKPAVIVALNCSETSNILKPVKLDTSISDLYILPGIFRNNLIYNNSFEKLKRDIQDIINWAAHKVGVSPALLRAVAQAESNGNQNAVSPVGAIGVMQLMPETAKSLGVNPYNVEQNILGGAKYLRYQLDRFDGNVPKALAAYNAGPGAVEKYGGVPPYKETRNYVAKVMASAGRVF